MSEVGYNATVTGLSSANAFSGYLGIIMIAAVFFILLGLAIHAVSTTKRASKIRKLMEFLGKSCLYFGHGIGCIALVGIPSLAIYWLGSTTASGDTVPLTYMGYALGGFFGIAGIGYVFKTRVIDKLKKKAEVKKHVEHS